MALDALPPSSTAQMSEEEWKKLTPDEQFERTIGKSHQNFSDHLNNSPQFADVRRRIKNWGQNWQTLVDSEMVGS